MARILTPPRAPPLPTTLPLEAPISRALDRAGDAWDRSPVARRLTEIREKVPTLAAWDFPTPIGTMRLPALELPEVPSPRVDQRRKELIKAAIGDDVSGLVEKIPFVGVFLGPVADFLEDLAGAKIDTLLTPSEREVFRNWDKSSPSTTLAALATFKKVRGR